MTTIPLEKQAYLLASLQQQYAALVAARAPPTAPEPQRTTHLSRVGDTYGLCNSLFDSPRAYTSTPVLVMWKDHAVKSLVQIKRDMHGNPAPTVTVHGPSYRLVALASPDDRATITLHAASWLHYVYAQVVYLVRGESFLDHGPTLPCLPSCVKSWKFDARAVCARALDALMHPPPLSPVSTSDEDSERVAKRARVDARVEEADEVEQRCYICWESVECDVLFPCRVQSHACCRKCVQQLQQVWSSTTHDGHGTIKCPQCANEAGVLTTTAGEVIRIKSQRYPIRKQRQPRYNRTRILR